MPDSLTITRPDDFHLHLRDGAILEAVVGASSHFARATVMPNLVPPVATAEAVAGYSARIREVMPEGMAFEPLMTLYLTDATTPQIIDEAAPHVIAVKLYPAHATTNSAAGVSNVEGLTPVLERMAERGMLLLVHGEVSDPAVDIFDREAVFLENVLDPLRRRVPSLRVVLEHMSTARAVEYVADGGENLGGTITAHHLVIDRNDLLAGGIRPHNYCLPIVKRARATARRSAPPPPEEARASSSAPTARRIPITASSDPAGRRVASRRRWRSPSSPASSRRPGRSIGWSASSPRRAPRSTACRRMVGR